MLNPDSYHLAFPTYLGATYDASTTNLTYHIAPPVGSNHTESLEVILSFLSPITPTSTLRQSIPASYLTVHVSGGFNLNVYIDLNGQWVSGDRGNRIEWELHEESISSTVKGIKTWKVKRETEQFISENRDRAEWGSLHFTGPSVSR